MCSPMSRSSAPRSRCSSAHACAFAARRRRFARAMAKRVSSARSCDASAMTSMPSAEPLARERPVLLVVDDDPLITEALSFALAPYYEVHACDSRAAAIELVRTLGAPPALALVDLGLPPAPHAPDEGFQLIADLLAHSPRMKIFVLSGQNDAANARHARALGAWEFVAKPTEPAALKRLLERALELAPAENVDL